MKKLKHKLTSCKVKKSQRLFHSSQNDKISELAGYGPKIKKWKIKTLVHANDALFSLAVRAKARKEFNGLCPFCRTRPIQCCFHFVTRSKRSVRWDFSNATGSCHGDNYRMEFDAHPYINWYIKKYGYGAYDELIKRSHKITKFGISELLEIKRGLELILASSSPIYPEGTPRA